MADNRLAGCWQRCWEGIGRPVPAAAIFDDLVRRYSEPQRHYHTLQHIEECFGWLDAAAAEANSYGEIGLALWFHDAVYDTARSDNEKRSAALAREVLNANRIDGGRTARIERTIVATARHFATGDADTDLLLDIDLSILGAEPQRYEEYRNQIRREYASVAPRDFALGRGRLLRAFLARERIYLTAFFRRRLETAARANLVRELEAYDA